MTEDQFVEEIESALNAHISRDPSIADEDKAWEARNFARTLSKALRLNGLIAPEIADAMLKERADQ